MQGQGLKIGIVLARFNEFVTKQLYEGAVETLQRYGVESENIDVVNVPGSFEIPTVAVAMGNSGSYDAIICIGAIIRGSTSHYDAVVQGCTSGTMNAGMTTGVPTIFSVLTCDTMEQAIDRAGGKAGNKGSEGAVTAIEMANLLKELEKDGKAFGGDEETFTE